MIYVVTMRHDDAVFTEVYTSLSEVQFLQRTGLHAGLTVISVGAEL